MPKSPPTSLIMRPNATARPAAFPTNAGKPSDLAHRPSVATACSPLRGIAKTHLPAGSLIDCNAGLFVTSACASQNARRFAASPRPARVMSFLFCESISRAGEAGGWRRLRQFAGVHQNCMSMLPNLSVHANTEKERPTGQNLLYFPAIKAKSLWHHDRFFSSASPSVPARNIPEPTP